MTDPHADNGSFARAPRWVKIFGIIAVVLVLVVAIMLVVGGGKHGPGRHTPSGDARDRVPAAGMDGHTP